MRSLELASIDIDCMIAGSSIQHIMLFAGIRPECG